MIYDLHDVTDGNDPVWVAAIARETYKSEESATNISKTQISFSYSDGFGREIQKKIQAEPYSADAAHTKRWVGSGWTIFNNKGKTVQQYEPFFTTLHSFEFDKRNGVTPTLFYDPLQRVIATLNSNHTYQKVVFDAWQQISWQMILWM